MRSARNQSGCAYTASRVASPAIRARFIMGLRRRGAMGERDARTQGGFVSAVIRARLRTRQRAAQRGPAAQRVIVNRALKLLPARRRLRSFERNELGVPAEEHVELRARPGELF